MLPSSEIRELRRVSIRLTTSFDARHPFAMAFVRFAAGVWLFVLFTFLLAAGKWWGVMLLLPAGILLLVGARVLAERPRA